MNIVDRYQDEMRTLQFLLDMQDGKVTRLRADLQLAAETLRRYEASHWAQATKAQIAWGPHGEDDESVEYYEATRKAEANAVLAARFEQTLKETE